VVQEVEVVVLPTRDWAAWEQGVRSATQLKDLVTLILEVERAVFAHAEPYTVAQREASKDADGIDLETIGVGGPEGPGRRGKKLLWHSAAEEACWRQGALESKIASRLGFVVNVFLRRARMLLDKIGVKKTPKKRRVPDRTQHKTEETIDPKPKMPKVNAPPPRPEPLFFRPEDDVIWGKVPGYPWWPAEFCDLYSGGIKARPGARLVRFFNTEEFAFLQPQNMMSFDIMNIERVIPQPHDRHFANVMEAVRCASECAILMPEGRYRTGEFVWARFNDDVPWWPAEAAMVSSAMGPRPGQKLIVFVDINEFCWVDEERMKPFDPADCEEMVSLCEDSCRNMLLKAVATTKKGCEQKRHNKGGLNPISTGATMELESIERSYEQIKVLEMNDEEEV